MRFQEINEVATPWFHLQMGREVHSLTALYQYIYNFGRLALVKRPQLSMQVDMTYYSNNCIARISLRS